MNTTLVRHSPIILIRTFIAIQILGFLCYLAAAALGNYKYDLYTQLSFTSILSYQMAKLILLLGAELVMTVYAFSRWYMETYMIEPGIMRSQWGVFFKRKKTIPLGKDVAMKISKGPLGKLLDYGTIHINNEDSKTSLSLSNISHPERFLKIIEKNLDESAVLRDEHSRIGNLLAQDEHEKLEFKSSLRFDLRNKQINHDLERSVMKTVAGFLNSSGGDLVIGVADLSAPGRAGGQAGGREIIGLQHDYKTLKRVNSDGFESHFTQVFNAMIGPEFRHLVELRFPIMNTHELCVIHVAPSARPIYLKLDDNEHFYVRTGNVTTPLKMSEMESYTRSHWIKRTS